MSFIADMWGASKAASASKDAANTASATELQMFDQARADEAPWRDAGGKALTLQQALLGMGGNSAAANAAFNQYQNSDGYKFRMGQGEQAVQRSAAARGGLNSGATLKALMEYGQGVGSDEFQRYYGDLAGMSGTGASMATTTGNQGIQTGNQIGQNTINAGNARASMYQQFGHSIGQGIGQIGQAFGFGG